MKRMEGDYIAARTSRYYDYYFSFSARCRERKKCVKDKKAINTAAGTASRQHAYAWLAGQLLQVHNRTVRERKQEQQKRKTIQSNLKPGAYDVRALFQRKVSSFSARMFVVPEDHQTISFFVVFPSPSPAGWLACMAGLTAVSSPPWSSRSPTRLYYHCRLKYTCIGGVHPSRSQRKKMFESIWRSCRHFIGTISRSSPILPPFLPFLQTFRELRTAEISLSKLPQLWWSASRRHKYTVNIPTMLV